MGLLIGLAGAYLAADVLASQLFGVTTTDPLTFVAVAALLIVVALASSYRPSRAAARIDPQLALKGD
jgi:ABC-type antimicrobial peptide transport system permease subunit